MADQQQVVSKILDEICADMAMPAWKFRELIYRIKEILDLKIH